MTRELNLHYHVAPDVMEIKRQPDMKSSTQVLSDSPRRVGTFRGLGEAEVDVPLSGGGGGGGEENR